MQNYGQKFGFFIFTLLSFYCGCFASVGDANQIKFSYEDYAVVLERFVNDAGMVNYGELKAQPKELDNFLLAMARLEPNDYDRWSEKEKITFWLNVYNACTLKAIIDNYPIKSSFFKSLHYPQNSIRQIDGVWNRITFEIMNKDYTLEHIEHKILRREFNEPRIHTALVCAAMGCPPLRNEPYIGQKLDFQLDDQSRKFLSDPAKLKFDAEKRVLYLSPIFKWFAGDFVKSYSKQKSPARDGNKTAVLDFVSKYLPKEHLFFRPSKKVMRIKYLDYDWSLNEQKGDNAYE